MLSPSSSNPASHTRAYYGAPNQDPDDMKRNIDSFTPMNTPLVPYTTRRALPDGSPFTLLSQTQHDSSISYSTYSDCGVAEVPRPQQQHQQPQPSRSAGLGNAAPFVDSAITNGSSTSHNPKFRFRCSNCGKGYAQQQGLNRHYKERHDPNICVFCDYQWTRPYEYRTHITKHHPDVDPDPILGKPVGSRRKTAIFIGRRRPQIISPPLLPLIRSRRPAEVLTVKKSDDATLLCRRL